jgi:hypothetical protein
MNEQIQLLAEQAGFYVADGKIYIPSTSEEITTCQKKFAELIVQECAKISLECGINLNREDFRQGIARNIKQHFGVEE